jgi:hypothetical protein
MLSASDECASCFSGLATDPFRFVSASSPSESRYSYAAEKLFGASGQRYNTIVTILTDSSSAHIQLVGTTPVVGFDR